MPSSRRFRATLLLLALVVFTAFYTTSGARQTRSSTFYTKTSDALSRPQTGDRQGDDNIAGRLRAAEEAAKKSADKKAADYHGSDVPSAPKDGTRPRKILKDGSEHVLMQISEAERAKKKGEEEKVVVSEEVQEARTELNYILKRSPIIIFSKTYCPYSKKAKAILGKYKIDPEPYIVELDDHALGESLQAELSKTTGRSTVPNVLVNGKSIGGGDDVEKLHESGKLEETIRSMGGKRIQISLRRVKESRD